MKSKKPNSCNTSMRRAVLVAAMDRREALIQLCELAPRTSFEVSKHFKVSISVARSDLAMLCRDGWIESSLHTIKNDAGKSITIAKYIGAAANDQLAQITRSSWEKGTPPMFEPMAYLFGRMPQEASC